MIIDVVSDTVWPWCFVGKRRLEDAIAKAKIALPHVEFDVNWRPFQLNPSAPTGRGVDKQEMYIQKFEAKVNRASFPNLNKTESETTANQTNVLSEIVENSIGDLY